MGQISKVMRYGQTCYFHYCPACENLHSLPFTWTFNGDVEKPTFQPSFRQMQVRDGKDCHYNITNGQIEWHGDSWHGRSGKEPMVDLSTTDYADFLGPATSV